MELSTKLLFLAAFVLVMIIMGTNHYKKKKKIIFFGDSITEYGTRPGGYITHILEFMKEQGVEERYELVNAGEGGNTVPDLVKRVESDVLLRDPYAVVLFIGVNDVWKQQFKSGSTEADTFKTQFEILVNRIKGVGARLIICTPAIIGENEQLKQHEWQELAACGKIQKEIAALHDVPVVDFQAVFRQYYLQTGNTNANDGVLTTDGVHLNSEGNKLVATELWKLLHHYVQ